MDVSWLDLVPFSSLVFAPLLTLLLGPSPWDLVVFVCQAPLLTLSTCSLGTVCIGSTCPSTRLSECHSILVDLVEHSHVILWFPIFPHVCLHTFRLCSQTLYSRLGGNIFFFLMLSVCLPVCVEVPRCACGGQRTPLEGLGLFFHIAFEPGSLLLLQRCL